MRWLSFAILAAVAIVFQTALAPHLAETWLGASPDWVLLFLVYLGLYAPAADARIAGWILGVCLDLCGSERMGLGALVYGLSAASIVQVRELLFREHPLTSMGVTFVFGLGVRAALGVYWLSFHAEAVDWPYVREGLLTVLYTALLAPYLHRGLRRIDPLLGLRPARRAGRGRR